MCTDSHEHHLRWRAAAEEAAQAYAAWSAAPRSGLRSAYVVYRAADDREEAAAAAFVKSCATGRTAPQRSVPVLAVAEAGS